MTGQDDSRLHTAVLVGPEGERRRARKARRQAAAKVETDARQHRKLEARAKWEAEQARRQKQREDTLKQLTMGPLTEAEEARRVRQNAARRARRRAERADKKAARFDHGRLGVAKQVRAPRPSAEETRVLTEEERRSLDSYLAAEPQTKASDRLYSGSKDAEERAERLKGPSKEEMAEREETAERRRIRDEEIEHEQERKDEETNQ